MNNMIELCEPVHKTLGMLMRNMFNFLKLCQDILDSQGEVENCIVLIQQYYLLLLM